MVGHWSKFLFPNLKALLMKKKILLMVGIALIAMSVTVLRVFSNERGNSEICIGFGFDPNGTSNS